MTPAEIALAIHEAACEPDADQRQVSPNDVIQAFGRLLASAPGYASTLDDVIIELKRIAVEGIPE